LSAPLDAQIEITNTCNQKCYHCYNYWKYKQSPNENALFLDDAKIGRIFEELVKNRIISITITGGEPFLYPKSVLHSLHLARTKKIHININSNLTLLNKALIDNLKQIPEVSILTSLLSHKKEIHNQITGCKASFERIVKNIRRCLQNGINITVNMVLLKENFGDLYETATLAKNIGVETFCATRAIPPLNSTGYQNYSLTKAQIKESLDMLLRIESELGLKVDILNSYPLCLMGNLSKYYRFLSRMCVGGKTTITIGSNGEVRPCPHSDMIYGNILEENLKDIWLRLGDWKNDSFLPDFCKEISLFGQIQGKTIKFSDCGCFDCDGNPCIKTVN